jgi:glycosyltransferase involved in cell wall biosynthesis
MSADQEISPPRSEEFNSGLGSEFLPLRLPSLPGDILVSVLISNYNYEKYVAESVQSVLDQTYTNFELIICDDGSTDGSLEIIQRFTTDNRLHILQQPNSGQPAALNNAYSAAKGEIICLLDSDDAFARDKVEQVVAAFRQSPDCGVCIHPIQPIAADNHPIGPPYPRSLESGWVGPKAMATGAQCYGVPPTVGISLRRDVADIAFPIPLDYISPDAFLIRAAILSSRVISLPAPLGYYRVHGENITGLYYPTVKSARRVITDAQKYVESMRDFLAARYGPTLADRLQIEDNPNYWNNLLAYYILTGTIGFDAEVSRPLEMVRHLPPGRNRVIWRLLVILPRTVGRKLYRFWGGQSFLRGITRKVLYWFQSKSVRRGTERPDRDQQHSQEDPPPSAPDA